MDQNGVRFNHSGNGDLIKRPASNHLQSTFLNGTRDLIQSRFFTILVSLLFLIVSVNLILSLWIIHSLQIANGGLGDGNLLATTKRVTVKRQAKFNGWLTAEEINPVHRDQWLSIVGLGDQIQLADQADDQLRSSVLSISNGEINYQGPQLTVNKLANGSKQIQFSIDSNQLTISSLKELKTNDWGLVVDEALETSSIKGDHYHDLRLESRMKGLTMEALSENINMRSKVGRISMNSLKDINLSASESLNMESPRIRFKSLPKSKPNQLSQDNGTNNLQRKELLAYQLCTCENGRLFLTNGDGACYMSPEVCSKPKQAKMDEKME